MTSDTLLDPESVVLKSSTSKTNYVKNFINKTLSSVDDLSKSQLCNDNSVSNCIDIYDQ